MSRHVVALVVCLGLGITPGFVVRANAQEPLTGSPVLRLAALVPETILMPDDVAVPTADGTRPVTDDEGQRRPLPRVASAGPSPSRGSSTLLTSLYVSTAAMQLLDVHSTLTAVDAGAVERNPVMAGVARHRGAFLAMKAGVAATTILAAHRLSKKNKAAAVATLVAINSAYAWVVHHNYQVARSLR